MSCSRLQSKGCSQNLSEMLPAPNTSLYYRECQRGLFPWGWAVDRGGGQYFLCYQVLHLGLHLLSGLEAGVYTPKAFPSGLYFNALPLGPRTLVFSLCLWNWTSGLGLTHIPASSPLFSEGHWCSGPKCGSRGHEGTRGHSVPGICLCCLHSLAQGPAGCH